MEKAAAATDLVRVGGWVGVRVREPAPGAGRVSARQAMTAHRGPGRSDSSAHPRGPEQRKFACLADGLLLAAGATVIHHLALASWTRHIIFSRPVSQCAARACGACSRGGGLRRLPGGGLAAGTKLGVGAAACPVSRFETMRPRVTNAW